MSSDVMCDHVSTPLCTYLKHKSIVHRHEKHTVYHVQHLDRQFQMFEPTVLYNLTLYQ